MSPARKQLFTGRRVVCDGATGTMLLAAGVSLHDCLETLNLGQPERVGNIHRQYLAAGAEVIETNTFGANAFRLARHGLRDQVRQINIAGARLARAAGAHVVAGAIGPLGIQPGSVSDGEMRAAFAEQVRALAEGGVDLLMLETMMSLDEAFSAIDAARSEAPGLPLAVLMTVGEDGNCLDGASPETAAERLTELGVDAVGCNCSFGTSSVRDTIVRMRKVTVLPLVAMPSAGLPRQVEGRNIYDCSVEDMAKATLELIDAGALWVGGCCGTTPAHIQAMRSALHMRSALQDREAEG